MIRGEAIHKTYYLGRTELKVLRGVSVTFRKGEFAAVTGSSGSGKSTLLHVLSGLDVPQRGQVYYDDRPLFEPEPVRRIPRGRDEAFQPARTSAAPAPGAATPRVRSMDFAQRMVADRRNALLNSAFGFVFQFYHLLPEFDVLENVLLPAMVGKSIGAWLTQRGRDADRALRLLKQVGLGDRLKHRPNELSGGERQRVAIARALMNEPAVLFADEPTGNLDAKTGRAIFRLLQELNEAGQTIVMVTHDPSLADQTHRVVRLLDGRVESDGS